MFCVLCFHASLVCKVSNLISNVLCLCPLCRQIHKYYYCLLLLLFKANNLKLSAEFQELGKQQQQKNLPLIFLYFLYHLPNSWHLVADTLA